MPKKKKSSRGRSGAFVYVPAAVLLIVIIALFGVGVFFRVSEIEVVGASKYTPEQILEKSGLKKGDNLLFIDRKSLERKISVDLPYLSEVVIEKIIPDKVVIKVSESEPLAAIQFEGNWWIIDQKARALEKADSSAIGGKIKVTGLFPVSVAEGVKVAVEKGEQKKLDYLVGVLSAIQAAGIADRVGELDVTNIAKITFVYDGRFTVELGTGENVEYKISRMKSVASQLDPSDRGRIDVSNDEVFGRFIPEED